MGFVTAANADVEPRGIRLGVVRGVSYGLFGKPDAFVVEARALGAGLIRVYLYWGQVEPEPGRNTWDTVDALLEQLDGDEEVWITLCSSSPWATRRKTDFQPQSPALDLATYREFVARTVAHCAGRVRYWQCNNEPSNTDLLWAGTAEEYVAHLAAMYQAVKAEDPGAAVVLGGCGYDVFSSPEGSPPRQFFDHLAAAGRDHFDLFSVHLYGDVAAVPSYLDTARRLMRRHGYLKPVVVGEHAGPVVFEYPGAAAAMQETLAAAFTEPAQNQSIDELVQRAGQDTPERRAMAALYARMSQLPPQLQMFMAGCPAELEAKRHRINARQVVMRTLLALAGGVRRTAYWDLGPEVPDWTDPGQMMHVMFGKLPLLDYRNGELSHRHPAAEAFGLLARQLAGAQRVTRVEVDDPPNLYAFEVDRADRPPLLVLWDHRDPFDGEAGPAVPVTWPWPAPTATAVDAFGHDVAARVADGVLHLPVSLTPVYVTEGAG